MRLYGAVALAFFVTLGAGWVWGRSGRSELETGLRAATERAGVAEARGLVLEGRVNLFQMNFGEAAQKFGQAVTVVERVQTELRDTRQADRATRLDPALAALRDAQRLTLALDQSAHNKAAEALKALN